MRYHQGYPEKFWKFLYSLDAFLFFTSAIYMLSLIIEFGFALTPVHKELLGWFNMFVLSVSLLELFIKFSLSSSKSYFFGDEYVDVAFTSLLFLVTIYVGYVHLYKLDLPFHPAFLIQPHDPHWILLKIVLFIAILTQFKEFNKILLGLKIKPAQVLVIGFLGFIVIGTILLILPEASANRTSQSIVDALFTATSAVTTTGLIVVDTGSYYSLFGQSVILFLFQIGGLGYMVFVTFILLGWGGHMSLATRGILHESLGKVSKIDIKKFTVFIVIFALIFEVIGAGLLSYYWKGYFPLSKALFISVFHAVSAFCTAGFSTFSDSFIAYQSNIFINAVLVVTFMGGAFGFLVLYDVGLYLMKYFRRIRPRKILAHSKFIMILFAFLIVAGTFIVFTFEKGFSSLPFGKRLLFSFFQIASASSTTGFNSVDIGTLSPSSLFVTIFLMLIGAAPGGTAGGIKITTFGIILLFSYALLKGREDVNLFGRQISFEVIKKAFAIGFLTILWINISVTILTITEKASFLQILFESVSASGTVGLSTGITPSLSTMGKLIISINMFIGRVGPLMIGASLVGRPKEVTFKYAKEDILVG